MELLELYKRLGRMIDLREVIRKDLESLQSVEPKSVGLSNRIKSLEDEFDRAQLNVLAVDREIRDKEMKRASVHQG